MARGGVGGKSRKLRIFISYRRQDSVGHAGRLYDALASEFGTDAVFIDIDAIPLGVDFSVTLREEVARCNVMIAVVGPQWLTVTDTAGRRRVDNPQDYVRMELEAAFERDALIIPVLVHGAEMPRPDELPPEIAAFSRRNALELSDHRWHAEVRALCQELARLPTRPATAPGTRSPVDELAEAQLDELPPPAADATPGHSHRRSTPLHQMARVGIAAAAILVLVPVVLAVTRGGEACASGTELSIINRGSFPEQRIIRARDEAEVVHAGIYVGNLFAAFPDEREANEMNEHIPIAAGPPEIPWSDFQELERRPRDGLVVREWAPRAGKPQSRYYIAVGGAMFLVEDRDTLRSVGIEDLDGVPVVPRKVFDRRDYAVPADGTLLKVAGSDTVYEVSNRVGRTVNACSDAHVVRLPPSPRILNQVPGLSHLSS